MIARSVQQMRFTAIPSFSPAEAELLNWANRFVRRDVDWEDHLRNTLGDLLESPDQKEWVVYIKHWMDNTRPATQVPFQGDTVTIGRTGQSNIVLTESTINLEHARLLRRGEGFYIEDLGSRLGTFIGDKKLPPHTPVPLSPGATFTIFPYSLEITSRYIWRREDRFRVQGSSTRFAVWQEAVAELASDALAVGLRFPPAEGACSFAISGRLLDELLRGLIGKDHLGAAGLLAADAGCLDYVLAAFSERLREDLRWPFVAELGSWFHQPQIAPGERGLLVSAQIGIRDCTGVVRLFLPLPVLEAMRSLSPAPVSIAPFREAVWSCALELAAVPLAASDAEGIAPGDTVLFKPHPVLKLPGGYAGWPCIAEGSNFRAFRLHKSIERFPQVESSPNPGNPEKVQPELRDLPVLLQVILGERQFSLADLQTFTEGTLISLERGETEPVRLAVNGKVLGSGELVRIEDHLGVRVLGWNQ